MRGSKLGARGLRVSPYGFPRLSESPCADSAPSEPTGCKALIDEERAMSERSFYLAAYA